MNYGNLNLGNIAEADIIGTKSNLNLNNQNRKQAILTNHFAYILKCNDGSYYTSYTSDIKKRINQHQSGHGCSYTKTRIPIELVYTEILSDKPSTLKKEKQIKKLDTYKKERLIEKSRIE